MFTLENILNYTSANIQIIGVFIAIIGGLIATKLLNTKIEKDTLKEKLEKLNKEIRFYQKRKITDEKELYKINKADYITYIYEKVRNKDFKIEDYEDYNLTFEQRREIVKEINELISSALKIFSEPHYKDDIPNILKQNHIKEDTIEYMIYKYVGNNTRIRKTRFGILDPTDIDFDNISFVSIPEKLNERDLNNRIDKFDEFIEWKMIEKEDIESKFIALNNNLYVKKDVLLFVFITIFAIIIPQIILSTYPLFVNYKWLKYIFAIYSIITFIISMFFMLWYIFKLFLGISNNDIKFRLWGYYEYTLSDIIKKWKNKVK